MPTSTGCSLFILRRMATATWWPTSSDERSIFSVPDRRSTSLTRALPSEGSPDPLESPHVPVQHPPRPLPRPDAPTLGRAPAALHRLRRHCRRLLSVRGHLLARLLLLETQAPASRP